VFQFTLAIGQLLLVVEALDRLGPIGLDEAELADALVDAPRFVADELVPAFEPPEHSTDIGAHAACIQTAESAHNSDFGTAPA